MTPTPRVDADARRYDVVVVGSVNRDYVCRVGRLPRPGETVLGGEALVGSGGKGGNQAVAASLLGARTVLVARVGQDADGLALVDDLTAASVSTDEVVALPGVRTGLAFVLVAGDGENSIAVAPGANDHLDANEVVESLRRLLSPPAVLVVQAEIPAGAFDAAVRTAADLGCRAVANLAPYRPVPEDVLALCDPLVVNESEASGLLSSPVDGADGARRAAAALRDRCRSVVVTAGPLGAVVADRSGVHHVPAERVEVVDTTGAGDAFTGALAAALSSGRDLRDAARLGVRAGAYAAARPGAQASFPSAVALGVQSLRTRS